MNILKSINIGPTFDTDECADAIGTLNDFAHTFGALAPGQKRISVPLLTAELAAPQTTVADLGKEYVAVLVETDASTAAGMLDNAGNYSTNAALKAALEAQIAALQS